MAEGSLLVDGPFVKAIGRDQASARFERLPESRCRGRSFGSGIEQSCLGHLPRPEGKEPPSALIENLLAFRVMMNEQDILRGGDVAARLGVPAAILHGG